MRSADIVPGRTYAGRNSGPTRKVLAIEGTNLPVKQRVVEYCRWAWNGERRTCSLCTFAAWAEREVR